MFLHMPREANPFLGWRAIRVCLDDPELFHNQLRAAIRAFAHGNLRLLIPLVTTVDELALLAAGQLYDFLDSRDATDALEDPDGDSFNNLSEHQAGSDPGRVDYDLIRGQIRNLRRRVLAALIATATQYHD